MGRVCEEGAVGKKDAGTGLWERECGEGTVGEKDAER